MRVAIGKHSTGACSNITRDNFITQAVAAIGTLIISNGPTVGFAATGAAGTAFLHFAGAKVFLTRQREVYRVGIGAVRVSGLNNI